MEELGLYYENNENRLKSCKQGYPCFRGITIVWRMKGKGQLLQKSKEETIGE